MQLTLGPLLYYWPKTRLDAFHDAIAAAPVDRVYLGEAVCSRRHEYRTVDWLDAAARLADAGKEVVLSSQVLMESESDLKALRRMIADGRFLLEANDMGAVHMVAGHAPFVAGPHLNIYCGETLAFFASLGANRWVPPFEMSRASLASILAGEAGGRRYRVVRVRTAAARLLRPMLHRPALRLAEGRLPVLLSRSPGRPRTRDTRARAISRPERGPDAVASRAEPR